MPPTKKKPPAKALPPARGPPAALLDVPGPDAAPGGGLKGAVDIRSIVSSATAGGGSGGGKPEEKPLGPDFDDEDDVPPLL